MRHQLITTGLFLFAVSLFTLTFSARAEDNGTPSEWEQVKTAKKRGEVSTWVRPVPGNALKAFKGQVEVPHNMLTVFAVLGDVERFPEWVYQCDSARLMPEFGVDISYVHIAGIWPVDARDAVVKTAISQDPDTLAIHVHSVDAKDLYPEQRKTVRLPSLDNSFIFEPLSNGWTRITFKTFVNPGGAIPAWLANMVAVRAPRDTLEDMSKIMAEEKYQLRDTGELPTQFPQLASMTFPNSDLPASE